MTREQCSLATNLELATLYCANLKSTKGRALRVFLVTLLPNDMAVCFNHADSFELGHFDQNCQLIFWLNVNKDTVSEASILEYDRYEPRLGAKSCHRYPEFWQVLEISTYYVNHVLLVIWGLWEHSKMFLRYSSWRSPVEIGPCTSTKTWMIIW